MEIHIALSSDENYVPFLATAIISAIENNANELKLRFHIISVGISPSSQDKIKEMIVANNAKCTIYDFERSKEIVGDFVFEVAKINKYARLYLSKLLPKTIEKVIYLDCDALVLGSFKGLWEIDIEKYSFAGVVDVITVNHKLSINIPLDCKYFNSGMLLMNLKKFRDNNSIVIVEEFMKTYVKRKVKYGNDQAVINALFYDDFYTLPPSYNCITPFYLMKSEQLKKLYGLKTYYSNEELQEAIVNPIFVHLTPSFITRPWVKGSEHPLTDKYLMYLRKTPWKDFELKKDNRKFKIKFVAFLFKVFPFDIFYAILKMLSTKNYFSNKKIETNVA
ncbi:glycosyltransferase family 8 protein [Tamlana sp. 2201CG12-4]|uniref:glycosyltransferase family 8 protein n=1 Tax=Tamlana sp. 2201CG12-4 TaxID=3112582 RepID=UPI002DB5FDA8|nr:glycosyltransferase family 8 protein [Tamlana sp. 2201CG12-4]MEC3908044.1 glycosyltransferase family 8 protein [Tamlana sp. 2201CG12-4]